MRKLSFVFAAILLLFIVSIPLHAAQYKEAPPQSAPKTPPIETSRLVATTATVEAVDQANRTVTLKGPNRTVTVKVGDEVKNLPQVKVGDLVNITYYESLVAQIYKKGETLPPSGMQAKQYSEGAPQGQMPAGTVARNIQITETVQSIDKEKNIVVLKAPDGSIDAVQVRDPKNMDKVEVGDTVLISLTQAVAVSVERAAGK
jgi:hypothetical protein